LGGRRDEAELKTAIVSKVRDHLRASQLLPVAPYQVGLKETSKELTDTLNRMGEDVGILSLVGMGGKRLLPRRYIVALRRMTRLKKGAFLWM